MSMNGTKGAGSIKKIAGISSLSGMKPIDSVENLALNELQSRPLLSEFLSGYTGLMGRMMSNNKAGEVQHQLDIREFEVSIKTGFLGLEKNEIKIII